MFLIGRKDWNEMPLVLLFGFLKRITSTKEAKVEIFNELKSMCYIEIRKHNNNLILEFLSIYRPLLGYSRCSLSIVHRVLVSNILKIRNNGMEHYGFYFILFQPILFFVHPLAPPPPKVWVGWDFWNNGIETYILS